MMLTDFLKNPSGKGDVGSNSKIIAATLDSKYEKLMKEKGKKITCKVYKVLTKEIYYFHLIIPTETERDNTYDVVIELSDLEGRCKNDSSIVKYDARFFSNAPSFAYTYAKVFRDNDLLVTDLIGKFEDEQVSQDPVVRNRYGIVGYDKYLYFGVKYIYESRMLSKLTIGYQAIRYSKTLFVPQIRSMTTIMKEYRIAEGKLKKRFKKDKPDKSSSDSSKVRTSQQGDAGIYQVEKTTPKGKVKPASKTISKKKTVAKLKKK